MYTNYTPKDGDRVGRHDWRLGEFITVAAVGRERFLASFGSGDEASHVIDSGWIKVEVPTPLPDCWYYVDRGGVVSYPCNTRAIAFDYPGMDALAVVHIWTDAYGVDHAEIERVTA